MSTLERAIAIAAEAHAGQADKAGAPYILHPIRVMLRMDTTEERIVAVLHDVLEDCPAWSAERLRTEGFGPPVIAALEALTRRAGEPYMDFVRRAAAHPIARSVKLADLEDNLDSTRLSEVTAQDQSRMERYRRAQALLRSR
jgi:(p)ppGpp synthase/HD superfamily hydrolase